MKRMRERIFFCMLLSLLLIVTLACGCCYTVDGKPTWHNDEGLRKLNLKNLSRLSIGMAKEQVLNNMGTISINCLGGSLDNPARKERLAVNGSDYEIVHYSTYGNDEGRGNDCSPSSYIAEYFQTPLVFKNNILIGWGRCFLRELSPEYDARFH